jgi:hypothetical protein
MNIRVEPASEGEKINVPVFPNPDVTQFKRFVDVLFKHADRKGFVSLRAFPHKKGNPPPIFIDPFTLDDPQFLTVTAIRAQQAATWHEKAVFCPPVATFKTAKSAAEDNVLEGVSLACECDEAPNAARVKLTEWLGESTLVMHSGGEWTNPETGEVEPKLHLHWRLKAPARTPQELKLLKEARQLFVQLVGGDPTAAPVCHPFRWPGSWHTKAEPRLATIVSESDNEIDLANAIDVLREEAGAAGIDASGRSGDFSRSGGGLKGLMLLARDPKDVARALAVIPNDGDTHWGVWSNDIGIAVFGASGGEDWGLRAYDEWSAKSPKYDPKNTADRWAGFHRSPPSRAGMGKLWYLAEQASPGWMNGDLPMEPYDPWGHFDPPSIPRGILPDIIEDLAAEQGRLIGCDPAAVAMSCLVGCAAVISDNIKVQPKKHNSEWTESARIWALNVGDPSTKKSPAMKVGMAPLMEIDKRLAKAYEAAREAYEALSKEEKAKEKPPRRTRLMVFNTTVEACQDIMKDSPDGIVAFQDEMSGWFGSMAKYSPGRSAMADRSFWLKAYDGGYAPVDRITRGQVFIENQSACLLGGIQLEPMRQIANECEDDGLLQRILPVILKPAVPECDEPGNGAVDAYRQLIDNLHKLEPPRGTHFDFNGTPLRFDAEAQKYRNELDIRHCKLAAGVRSFNPKLATHIGKYNGIFARLCVVWHCCEHASGALPVSISEKTAKRAGAFLHDFLLPHALAFHSSILGMSDDHDQLADIAGYILSKKLTTLTSRDVKRDVRTMKKFDKKTWEAVLDQMDSWGWLDIVPGPRPTSPKQGAINPMVHRKFDAKAEEEVERRKVVRETMEALGVGQRRRAA